MAKTQVGVPIRLLHEGEGHMVSVEIKNGEVYRGTLKEAEDTMNCYLDNVTLTAPDGRVSKLEQVYIRGSQVKFMILPDLLKKSPAFTKVQTMKKKSAEKDGGKGGKGKPFKGKKQG
mmetsp:Transcript_28796/g.58842  ORF Transcript_28796/g.58842 Transcript_28796/m.58842 type:complete len:117 (-) Transcript_28796:247-597(-)|eukprot:CAMPEP_0171618304 /NCGR_PEP_ID=MMETSP0990-20121206/14663_1 /TAXON_ID=483369 /ORGANISM="non described non described, Strain CCMP2098" /LENGTH=116 /DNA_ID=CAMNT_0012183075 /DNA_START=90 /DNA_END=440 /DNA_ORIENTATION=+